MGIYNIVTGQCPTCGHPFQIQTKILNESGELTMDEMTIGSEVDFEDCSLLLKDPCWGESVPGKEEKHPVVAVIKNRKIVAFVNDKAEVQELPFYQSRKITANSNLEIKKYFEELDEE